MRETRFTNVGTIAAFRPRMNITPVAPDAREGRALIDATRPFAVEDRARTRWSVLTTFAALALATAAAASSALPWPLRLLASGVEGLLIVRGFVLYHDVMHGALLRGAGLEARALRGLFWAYGVLVLTPPNVWRQTHNYHHAHTAKIVGSHVGSFVVLTTDMWRRASPSQRRMYKLTRHPLTLALAYFTVFVYGMCAASFARNPRKNWDSALALALHLGLLAAVTARFGLAACAFALVIPFALAFALGAYLFYVQHNFEGVYMQPRESWSYTRAALESSSYLRTGRLMAWFTGNIGYHHVHHTNPGIPFYRLPDAMAAVPEFQHPAVVTLSPRDVLASFRLKLWDPASGRMVAYPSTEAPPV